MPAFKQVLHAGLNFEELAATTAEYHHLQKPTFRIRFSSATIGCVAKLTGVAGVPSFRVSAVEPVTKFAVERGPLLPVMTKRATLTFIDLPPPTNHFH